MFKSRLFETVQRKENLWHHDFDAVLAIVCFEFPIVVTFSFAAPEITENKLYSEKCDIWAMGIITFKL